VSGGLQGEGQSSADHSQAEAGSHAVEGHGDSDGYYTTVLDDVEGTPAVVQSLPSSGCSVCSSTGLEGGFNRYCIIERLGLIHMCV
jgi:hypothetical protein